MSRHGSHEPQLPYCLNHECFKYELFLTQDVFFKVKNSFNSSGKHNSAGISSDPVPRTVEQRCYCIPHTLFSFFLLSSECSLQPLFTLL